MGESANKLAALQSGLRSEQTILNEEKARKASEADLKLKEHMLGSEQQVNDPNFGGNPALLKYGHRYKMDDEYLNRLGAGGGWGHDGGLAGVVRQAGADPTKFGGIQGYVKSLVGGANFYMQEAERAAATGDYARADQIVKAVEDAWAKGTGGGLSEFVGEGYGYNKFQEDALAQAGADLNSPQAKIVGGLVKQGREFLDPNSATSERFKKSLTEQGDRAIALEARGATRAARDYAGGMGATRNPLLQSKAAAEVGRSAGAARAQLFSQAAAQYEDYSRSFAQNSVAFAQSWLQGTGGIRESFQESIAQFSVVASSILGSQASYFEANQRAAQASSAARMNSTGQLIGALGGAAMSSGGGGSGSTLGAALSGAFSLFGGRTNTQVTTPDKTTF